jgi:hypothetical protein
MPRFPTPNPGIKPCAHASPWPAWWQSSYTLLEAVRQGAIWDNLDRSGYDYSRIGTHSLQSGGATRLCLEGFNKDVICLIGWWSSNTYLKYIQPQVTQLATGASAKMATIHHYQWVDPNNSIT